MEEVFEVALEGHEPTTSNPEAEKEPRLTEIFHESMETEVKSDSGKLFNKTSVIFQVAVHISPKKMFEERGTGC